MEEDDIENYKRPKWAIAWDDREIKPFELKNKKKDIKEAIQEEKEEYMIKDNTHYGEFDFDTLTSYFDDYDLIEFGVKGAYDVPEEQTEKEQDNTKSTQSTCPTCGQGIDNNTPF